MIPIAVCKSVYDKAVEVFEGGASDGLDCLRAPDAEEELASFIRDNEARHAVLGGRIYSGALYGALPRGGVLARFGVGHDGLDKERGTEAGIFCTNTPGVLDDSVAEFAMGLILAASRKMAANLELVRAGGWKAPMGGELRGKTLTVVGCGRIGRCVASIASFGFGMRVVGCETFEVDAEELRKAHGISRVEKEFAEAAREADFVTLHIPSEPATRHFIDRAKLEAMPDKAWLINTARGAVVDEVAVYEALSSGGIAGAALDVFETEPYEPISAEKDLRTLSNAILTPHVGSNTEEANRRMGQRALRNIALAVKGAHDEMDLLNPEVLGGE